MNPDLVRAILEKRLIRFTYKGTRGRIVEPHDHGIKNGVEALLGFQIGGASRSGASRGWKHFDVTHITELDVLEQHFPGTRADDDQRHHTWDAVFARVT